jgi:YVTN family beta-propeller protein
MLGPLQVVDGDVELPLGSPKERALLGALLLRPGTVVSRERLIDELWGESPPPSAAKALNVHVSQLRKTLGGNGRDPIVTRAPGYALDVDAEQLDAMRFERLVADARERIAAGAPGSASGLLLEALALWRGPALAGVELEAAARNEVARLDELRLAAQMDRVDCDLALGRHEDVIAELELLVAEHPMRERLRGQYMLALYRAGRQADALRAYQDARTTLVEELGLEPSEALQRLERGILNHDPALEAPAGIPRVERRSAPRPRPRPRRRVLAATAAAVVIAAGAAIGVMAATGHSRVHVPPNAVAVIDPNRSAVTEAVSVDERPTAITVTPHAIWVINRGSGTLTAIDPRALERVRTIGLGGFPSSLAVDGDRAWVADAGSGTISMIDLNDGEVVRNKVSPGMTNRSGIGRVLVEFGHVLWTTRSWPPSLLRLARTDRAVPGVTIVAKSVPIPDIPRSAALSEGHLWIASATSGTVSVIRLRNGELVAHIPVGRTPTAIAVGPRAAWVADTGDSSVARIDPALFRITARVRLAAAPTAVALDPAHHAVWVSSSGGGTISRIDTRSNRVVKTIATGHRPAAVAVGGGRVWVAVDSR